jgi:hypothetical protein
MPVRCPGSVSTTPGLARSLRWQPIGPVSPVPFRPAVLIVCRRPGRSGTHGAWVPDLDVIPDPRDRLGGASLSGCGRRRVWPVPDGPGPSRTVQDRPGRYVRRTRIDGSRGCPRAAGFRRGRARRVRGERPVATTSRSERPRAAEGPKCEKLPKQGTGGPRIPDPVD